MLTLLFIGCFILCSIVNTVHIAPSENTLGLAPELYHNHLHFPWGVNFKFNGLLHHQIDRVWIVTKIKLPVLEDIPFPDPNSGYSCSKRLEHSSCYQQYVNKSCTDSKSFSYDDCVPAECNNQYDRMIHHLCWLTNPIIANIRVQHRHFKQSIAHLLQKDILNTLQQSQGPASDAGRNKRGIFSLAIPIVQGLATIAIESIGAYLRNKRDKVINQALAALETRQSAWDRKFRQYKDDFLLYGKYDIENIQSIIEALNSASEKVNRLENHLYSMYSSNKGFTSQEQQFVSTVFSYHLHTYTNFLQFFMVDQYKDLYERLEEVLNAIGKLSKGRLPTELFPPTTLLNITSQVEAAVKSKYPDYVLAIQPLSSYYDMKLVTFGTDKDNNLIVTFPVFIKTYHRAPLSLYEIETIPVPIEDLNTKANSYTQIIPSKPYIAINDEYYIQLKVEELRMCKHINFKYYCEELFLLKHKSKHSCESALFFKLAPHIIKRNCDIKYLFNATVPPSILDGGSQIVLANMMNPKRLICTDNNNLATPILTHPYVLVNRSILCNCRIESGFTYVLQNIGSCEDKTLPGEMQFTINHAFYHYFKEELGNSIPEPKDTYNKEEDTTFNISLQPPNPHSPLTLHPNLQMLYETMTSNYTEEEEITHLVTSLDEDLFTPDTFMFIFVSSILAIISLVATSILAYKYVKLKSLITSMTMLHMVHPTKAMQDVVVCQNEFLTYLLTVASLVGTLIYLYKQIKKYRPLHPFRYTNYSTLYIFLTDQDRYAPIRLRTINHPITLLKLSNINQVHTNLDKHLLWDTYHINWNTATLKALDNTVSLPRHIQIPLIHKYKVRKMQKQTHFLTLMLKHGKTWFTIQEQTQEVNPSVQEMV